MPTRSMVSSRGYVFLALRMLALLALLTNLLSCSLGTTGTDATRHTVLSRALANDVVLHARDAHDSADSGPPAKLIHLPFTISLQRHFLVKDPVFERSGYATVEKSIAEAIQDWSEEGRYQHVLLPGTDRNNRFASERLSHTSARLLNRKKLIDEVPVLAELATDLRESLGDSISDSAGYPPHQQGPSFFIAGSYQGHLKSASQLFKEQLSSNLRYLRGLGRNRLERPVRGFGKLYVVLLDGQSGRILWYGNSSAAPHEVGKIMRLLLSQT